MPYKSFLSYIVSFLSFFSSVSAYQSTTQDSYIQSLSSLAFYTQTWQSRLKSDTIQEDYISFSNENIATLWQKVAQGLAQKADHHHYLELKIKYDKAYQFCERAKCFQDEGQVQNAYHVLEVVINLIDELWKDSISDEEMNRQSINPYFILRSQLDPNVINNPHIPKKIAHKLHPHLLPVSHRMRSILDEIFLKTRVTTDSDTFHQAGFKTIAKGPRSYIRVASHPQLKGYLVKVYLDTVLKEKQHRPSWKWLVQRCIGAKKVKDIIDRRQMHHFVVAKKWIYCLPDTPAPPQDTEHQRHLALLLVTDMELVSKKENLYAWRHYITKEHLQELYVIISRAKGSSYRADNIAYTKKGNFAFIDTEYPDRGPNFTSIRHYLNSDMREYWDELVKNGGS